MLFPFLIIFSQGNYSLGLILIPGPGVKEISREDKNHNACGNYFGGGGFRGYRD